MWKLKCTVAPSSKYPFISLSLLDAPLALSSEIGFHPQIIRRTYTHYLHARSKVVFVSQLNQCEGKYSGKPEEGVRMLLRNTETTFQLHMTLLKK